jgi:DNA-binding CsgD family transcriptional regulator
MKLGALIFNTKGKLLGLNEEAVSIFSPSENIENNFPIIPKEIDSLINHIRKKKTNNDENPPKKYLSIGSDKFVIRYFSLGKSGSPEQKTHFVILIESPVKDLRIDFDKAREKYELSRREVEVLGLLCDGLSNKKIGEVLFISAQTVKDHIKHIMHKMGAHSRNQIMVTLLNHTP